MTMKKRQAVPLSDKVEVIHRIERGNNKKKKVGLCSTFQDSEEYAKYHTILKNKSAIRPNTRERPWADRRRLHKPAYDTELQRC